MTELPDAPWIVEAETWGVGNDEVEITCPECGAVNPEWFVVEKHHRVRSMITGCSECKERIYPDEILDGGDDYDP
jgi:uncharacterized Zn finger protein